MKKVDLKATIKKAGDPYNQTFVAKELGMTWRGVHFWYTGEVIPPPTKNEKLINLFRRNNIEPVWKNQKSQ